jgi:hypothetical protein
MKLKNRQIAIFEKKTVLEKVSENGTSPNCKIPFYFWEIDKVVRYLLTSSLVEKNIGSTEETGRDSLQKVKRR